MKNTKRGAPAETLSFTKVEKARIEKAAKVCGWRDGESAIFARALLLRNVEAVLRGNKPPRPGDLLRERLRSLMPAS